MSTQSTQTPQATNRRTRQREAIREEIKQIARRLMREHGTSALSLHAIARTMELTAPALYRYFPTRNDLVTALMAEAYQAHADAMRAASEAHPATEPVRRLFAAVLAYRDWAVAHPLDYMLFAGNPVPGYTAPMDVISEAARRGMDLLMSLVHAALPADRDTLPVVPACALSPQLEAMLETLRQQRGYDLPLPVVYVVVAGWGQAQGLVTQEIFHHLQPLLADPAELYRCEARGWLQRLGLTAPA
jgi:AcrR family transcriptional regulator